MSPTAEVKPMRSDARRNRDRIVASARELFATVGVEVPVEEIVQHAGLGMGTLYRHFRTKEELIAAVLEDAYAEFIPLAERCAAEEDAWTGLTAFLERTLALHAANRALKGAFASSSYGAVRARAMRARIRPHLRRMVERAKEQGSLREDVVVEDLPLVVWACARTIELTAGVAPDLWRRQLGLQLDGLRAPAATSLPAPPLTRNQLSRVESRPA